jgi:hypothetical protein
MREIDVWRNFLESGFSVDILERCIALQAPGEHLEIPQAKCTEDLLKLFFIIAALNE